jgi:hypothetical protein
MMATQGWLCWHPGGGTARNRPGVAHKRSSYEDPGLLRILRPMGEDAVVGEIHRLIRASEITIRTIGAKCRDTGTPQRYAVPPHGFRHHAPLRLLRVGAHFVSTGERTVTNWARPPKS